MFFVCIEALFETEKDILTGFTKLSLVHMKNRDGLVLPSPSVISICRETELCVQQKLKVSGTSLPKRTNLMTTISVTVLERCLDKQLFPTLDAHMFNTPTTNHVVSFIKHCVVFSEN